MNVEQARELVGKIVDINDEVAVLIENLRIEEHHSILEYWEHGDNQTDEIDISTIKKWRVYQPGTWQKGSKK